MKKQLLTGLMALALVGASHATILADWDSSSLGLAITDGNAAGITTSHTFSGLDSTPITDVTVRLNITGGYNGDLYGYLALHDANGLTTSVILLNRVGTSGSDPFGSSGSGFNHITLSDAGTTDIHTATGVPTGTYLADQYGGANSINSAFSGATANGTWTLFVADLSGGEVSTLDSWGLTISAVPEPMAWAMIIFCSGAILVRFILPSLRRAMVTT